MKTILVLKPTIDNSSKRFCKNCGTDISHKRKDAIFCCKDCCNTYHEIHDDRESYKTWHDAIVEGFNVRGNNYVTNSIRRR